MNPFFTTVYNGLKSFLSYKLTIGHTSFPVISLFELCALIGLVFFSESFLRRFIVGRFLHHTHLEPGLQFAIAKVAGYLYIALGVFISLTMVGFDLSSLAFLAGAAGVGLGFGLQNVVSNFVSGLILLMERPVAIGDRVDISGVMGRVTAINLRSTTIITNDNIAIIVPNSNFITNSVTNWSYGDPKVRLRVPVGVAYGTDLQKLKRVLLEVAQANPHVLHSPEPAVYFIAFGDSSLNFELAIWTTDMKGGPRPIRSELNFAVDEALRKNQIEIPFPQRDLHLRSGKAIYSGLASPNPVALEIKT